MPPKFWASSEDISVGSSVDSSIELNIDRVNNASRDVSGRKVKGGSVEPKDSPGGTPEGAQDNNALVRAMATSMSLPNLQPQQHANLFYLSLIEDRCRTQALKALNVQRRQEDWLKDDNHPEVRELAQHLFSEMKRDLLKAGIIPQELANKSLPDLQLYLGSFDALLHNIAATRTNQEISVESDRRMLKNDSHNGEYSSAFDYSGALVRRNRAMAEADPAILSLVSPNSARIYPESVYCQQYQEIAMLGSGGEGAVYKAKYMVDRAEYAIKKVIISARKLRKLQRTSTSLSEKLKEVYALAKLNHPNVVRYHHSWVEFKMADGTIVQTEEQDSPSETEDNENEEPCKAKRRGQVRTIDSSSSGNIVFERGGGSLSDSSDDDAAEAGSTLSNDPQSGSVAQASYSEAEDTSLAQEVENLHLNFAQQDLISELDQTTNNDQSYDNGLIVFGHSSNAAPEGEEGSQNQNQSKKAIQRYSRPAKVNLDAILYIKMTAYPSTLQAFLRAQEPVQMIPGHCFHVLPTIRILLVIIDGLQYVHRRNIIHQDLKPGNIFLSILEPGEPATPAYVNVVDCQNCTRLEPIEPLYICPHIGDFGMIKEIKTGKPIDETASKPEAENAKEAGTFKIGTLKPSTGTYYGNLSAYKAGDSFLSGTGPYKPPWIRGIKPIVCPKRDCYALGAIALEMIYKFGSDSERAHVFNQVRNQGVFPREVRDHKLGECIMGMLQADRDQRWSIQRVKEFLVDMEGRLLMIPWVYD